MEKYFFSEIKPEYYDSIKQYRNEMLKENSDFDGCSGLQKFDDIEKWDLECKLFERYDSLPPGYSIGFEYLYLLNDEVVGMLNFRPEAESHPFLSKYGGHIGYSIKPTYRKKGIGTRMLKDFLPICKKQYHLDKVLITCNKNNEGSRRIILNNNGVYENDIYYSPDQEYLERYWITL